MSNTTPTPNCTAEGCPKRGLHFTYEKEKRPMCEAHFLEWLKVRDEELARERMTRAAAESLARDLAAEEARALQAVMHDEDGVVIEDAPPPPPKRRKRGPKLAREQFLTPAERAELEAQAAWRLEERERKAKETEAMLALLPVESTQTEGEPPILSERLIELDARTCAGNVLAEVKRPNGSRLMVTSKHYDGTSKGFGARTYIHCAIWFRKNPGKLYRSKGVAIERVEMRALAAALISEADRLDTIDVSKKTSEG
jgi:hypothetical protein